MLILYRYIWLVYVYFGLSADILIIRANSPHHYRGSFLFDATFPPLEVLRHVFGDEHL
jgi:hypothetical protein